MSTPDVVVQINTKADPAFLVLSGSLFTNGGGLYVVNTGSAVVLPVGGVAIGAGTPSVPAVVNITNDMQSNTAADWALLEAQRAATSELYYQWIGPPQYTTGTLTTTPTLLDENATDGVVAMVLETDTGWRIFRGNDASQCIQRALVTPGVRTVRVPSGDYLFSCRPGGPLFQVGATYALGDQVTVLAAYSGVQVVYRCVQAGVSGATPTGLGLAITSGGTKWLSVGIDIAVTLPLWAQSTAYTLGDEVFANGNGYRCISAGNSAASGTGPSGTSNNIVDGTVHWKFIGSAIGPIIIGAENGSGVGQTLQLGSGVYDNENTSDGPIITIGSNCALRGAGRQVTQIVEPKQTRLSRIGIVVTDNVSLSNDAVQDGNKDFLVENFSCVSGGAAVVPNESSGAINLGNVVRAHVRGITIIGTAGGGIWIGGSSAGGYLAIETTVSDVRIEGVAAQGLAGVNSRELVFEDFEIIDCGNRGSPSTYVDLEVNDAQDWQRVFTIRNFVIDARPRTPAQSLAGYGIQILAAGVPYSPPSIDPTPESRSYMGLIENGSILGAFSLNYSQASGNTLTISAPDVDGKQTITGLSANSNGIFFTEDDIGGYFLFTGFSQAPNNAQVMLTDFLSPTSVKVYNPAGVAEGPTAGVAWTFGDGPSGIQGGVAIFGAEGVLVTGVKMNRASTAVLLFQCANCDVVNNSIQNSGANGNAPGSIQLSDARYCRVRDNTIMVDAKNAASFVPSISETTVTYGSDFNEIIGNSLYSNPLSPNVNTNGTFSFQPFIYKTGANTIMRRNTINSLDADDGGVVGTLQALNDLCRPHIDIPLVTPTGDRSVRIAGWLAPGDGGAQTYGWNSTLLDTANDIDIIDGVPPFPDVVWTGAVPPGRWVLSPPNRLCTAAGAIAVNTFVKLDPASLDGFGQAQVTPMGLVDAPVDVFGLCLDAAAARGDDVRVVLLQGILCPVVSDGNSAIAAGDLIDLSPSVAGNVRVAAGATSVGRAYTATKAIGSITSSAKAAYHNNDNFVLNDGVNPAITFEYKVDGSFVPTPGDVTVDISGATTAAQVAAIVLATIRANHTTGLIVFVITATADPADATITNLVNDTPGTAGNVAITKSAGNPDVVTGMSNGTAGAPLMALYRLRG